MPDWDHERQHSLHIFSQRGISDKLLFSLMSCIPGVICNVHPELSFVNTHFKHTGPFVSSIVMTRDS